MPTVADCCAVLENLAPSRLAAEWDNVGLLLGDGSSQVHRLMTCLTVTPEVVAEAIAKHVELVVSHHPVLFRGTKRLVAQSGEGRLLWPLARAGIAVYSPHTAFDNAHDGINDFLASTLGLQAVRPLRKGGDAAKCKVVVFVPEGDLQRVSDAMFDAGAGVIGQYRQCSFRPAGMGTFFGTEGANPTVGQVGRREDVPEWRLEVVCPEAQVSRAIAAMRGEHSYEEPAFDVYPLKSMESSTTGEGRIGELPEPISLQDLARLVKARLSAGATQFVGEGEGQVKRVAIACGAAGEFLDDARSARADVFLTGEMRFHDYLKARSQGIALVLPGHYATERPAVEELAGRLRRAFPEVEAWPSLQEADPANWV